MRVCDIGALWLSEVSSVPLISTCEVGVVEKAVERSDCSEGEGDALMESMYALESTIEGGVSAADEAVVRS